MINDYARGTPPAIGLVICLDSVLQEALVCRLAGDCIWGGGARSPVILERAVMVSSRGHVMWRKFKGGVIINLNTPPKPYKTRGHTRSLSRWFDFHTPRRIARGRAARDRTFCCHLIDGKLSNFTEDSDRGDDGGPPPASRRVISPNTALKAGAPGGSMRHTKATGNLPGWTRAGGSKSDFGPVMSGDRGFAKGGTLLRLSVHTRPMSSGQCPVNWRGRG